MEFRERECVSATRVKVGSWKSGSFPSAFGGCSVLRPPRGRPAALFRKTFLIAAIKMTRAPPTVKRALQIAGWPNLAAQSPATPLRTSPPPLSPCHIREPVAMGTATECPEEGAAEGGGPSSPECSRQGSHSAPLARRLQPC